MVIRHRAVQVEEKQERHHAILNAAERLLLRSPGRIASMAEVAHEAGLAKGTVYLYFPGKDELLLALHERNIDSFFRALIASLDHGTAVGIDDISAVTRRHVVEPPLFLPLASRCFGVMEQNVSADASRAFKQRMSVRLERAGAGLERHFRELRPGDGVVLLRHSYALILGLWQMTGSASERCADEVTSPAFGWNYAEELDRALRALWEGTFARAAGRDVGGRSL